LCDASSAAEGGKAVPPPIVDAAGLPRPKAQGPSAGCRQPNERAPRLACARNSALLLAAAQSKYSIEREA